MSPLDVFSPSAFFDPTMFTGEAGVSRLIQVAAHFPGGATGLIFAFFCAPVGPWLPAGVLLAQHLRIPPAFIFGLYLVADLFVVILLNPVYSFLRAQGRRNPTIRNIGRRTLALAMIGTRRLAADDVRAGHLAPALLRIATVGFGVDVYTAGALATGLPIPRLAGWTAAMVGDLVGFALLLGSSITAAHVFNDERATAAVLLVVALLGPSILRRIVPVLRVRHKTSRDFCA
jgi:hypothetical protein